jgi:hypothetical protein
MNLTTALWMSTDIAMQHCEVIRWWHKESIRRMRSQEQRRNTIKSTSGSLLHAREAEEAQGIALGPTSWRSTGNHVGAHSFAFDGNLAVRTGIGAALV